MLCPLCGHEATDGTFAVDLNTNAIKAGDKFFLTVPVLAEVAAILWDCYPRTATRGHLMSGLYGAADNQPDDRILDVYMTRLRSQLKGSGWAIYTVWGRGFRLTEGEWLGVQPNMQWIFDILVQEGPQTFDRLFIISPYMGKPQLLHAIEVMERAGFVQQHKVKDETVIEAIHDKHQAWR